MNRQLEKEFARAMWLCKNPLCGSMIYSYQEKYGNGEYCSKDCALEGQYFTACQRKQKKHEQHN